MQTIKTKHNAKVKVFSDHIPHEEYNQIKEMADFYIYKDSKIRIMPDFHVGAGCTIGTTMIIKDKVTPNLIGVDIGCGVLTIKLKEKSIDFEKLDNIIKTKVPNGFKIHSIGLKDKNMKPFLEQLKCKKNVDIERGLKSVGSLGGGNHFIEVDRNKKDELFLTIHSGSRNIGNQVAKYYQNLAVKTNEDNSNEKQKIIQKLKKENKEKEIQKEIKKIKTTKIKKDLAYVEGIDFDNYIHDMKVMQKYAEINRKTIGEIIVNEANLSIEDSFETIHNYIDCEKSILRKGAVSAEKDKKLIIPINMSFGCLLCIGKGNEDWNYSAPHGAGRLMSRSKAKKQINIDKFKEQMKDIYTSSVNQNTIDEAPDVYKSPEDIIKQIKDTVDIVDVIKPVYNFKSSELPKPK